MTLVAFHNDRAIKAEYLRRVRAHRIADEIRAGFYWKEHDGRWRGCAVGCTIHGNAHDAYERKLGIPEALAYIEDSIFERLSRTAPGRAKLWPEKFLAAVPIGADLDDVTRLFILWCLREQALPAAQSRADCVTVVERVIALYELPQREMTIQAAGAAGAAAAAAAAAGVAAAVARAAETAGAAATEAQATKLLELLAEAPV